jgi:hypothetical protein
MSMIMKISCVLLALTTIACNSQEETRKMIMKEFLNKPAEEAFEIFLTVYDKPYQFKSEEGMQHFMNFEENMKFFNQNKEELPSLEIDDTMDLPHSIWKSKINIPEEFNPSLPTQTSVLGYIRLNSLCLNGASANKWEPNSLTSWWCYRGGINTSVWRLEAVAGYSKVYYLINNASGRYLSYSSTNFFHMATTNVNGLMLNGLYGTLFVSPAGGNTKCVTKNADSKNTFTMTDSCDSLNLSQLFQYSFFYPNFRQDSNIKSNGQCLVSTPSLAFEECDGSQRQSLKFAPAFPTINGVNFVNIVDKNGLLLTVNKSDDSVSFQAKSSSSNLIQVFYLKGKTINENCAAGCFPLEDHTTGDYIAAVESTKILYEKWVVIDKVYKYLDPSNISKVNSLTNLNSKRQFFYTSCYSIYQLDVIFPC